MWMIFKDSHCNKVTSNTQCWLVPMPLVKQKTSEPLSHLSVQIHFYFKKYTLRHLYYLYVCHIIYTETDTYANDVTFISLDFVTREFIIVLKTK